MFDSSHADLFLEGRQLLRQDDLGGIWAEWGRGRKAGKRARPVSLPPHDPFSVPCSSAVAGRPQQGPSRSPLAPIWALLWAANFTCSEAFQVAPELASKDSNQSCPCLKLSQLGIKPKVTPAHLSECISHLLPSAHHAVALHSPNQWPLAIWGC